jgi:ATP-dependent Lhr-like helicase
VPSRNPGLRVALFLREHGDAWHALRFADQGEADATEQHLAEESRKVLAALRSRGPSFLNELVKACGLTEPRVHAAIADLAAAGLAVSDGFAGARAVMRIMRRRPAPAGRDRAGRWAAVPLTFTDTDREAAVEAQARALLVRYGVVFRRLLAREVNAAPWRALTTVFRRLEARGEIRGGRFVNGMSGEQFALPDAVSRLREVRKSARDGRLITISAVDPLNLTGVLTSGERVRSVTSSRLVYRDGVALAALEGDYVHPLTDIDANVAGGVATALAGRPLPSVTSGFVGR